MRKYGSSRYAIFACSLGLMAMVASGCDAALGLQDWQRDLLPGLPLILPLPLPGGAGPAGPPGAPGAPGVDGPNIIIARAVINGDGTLQDSEDITAVRTAPGVYELTIDTTGDTLPGGTTEDDFEIFLTLKEGTDQTDLTPFYSPISLVGTTLRVDVRISFGDGFQDSAFSVTVILPAG
ncbi:MAG TPA: hypothetical protein VJZ71_01520 [Phycisphaerae bacterium]|nr:hypothetical protein [Phycisphaerae bacterium]